jgi:hypothetical protein
MTKSLENILKKAICEPEIDLEEKILSCINRRNNKINNFKIYFFYILGFLSIISIVPAINLLISDFTSSGLYEYSILIFSNTETVFSMGKEYLLILLESLPILSLIITLSITFLLLISIKNITKRISRNQLRLAI